MSQIGRLERQSAPLRWKNGLWLPRVPVNVASNIHKRAVSSKRFLSVTCRRLLVPTAGVSFYLYFKNEYLQRGLALLKEVAEFGHRLPYFSRFMAELHPAQQC